MLGLTDADLSLRRVYAPHYPRILVRDEIGRLVVCSRRGRELPLVIEANVQTRTCRRLRAGHFDGRFYKIVPKKDGTLPAFTSTFDRLVLKDSGPDTRKKLERVFPELFGPDVGRRRGKGCLFAKAQRNRINAKRARRAVKEG